MYGAQGFSVLGFPCNQFDLLEPGNNGTEILNGVKYVRPGGGFVPNFQMFTKIEVNGANEEPLYTYLKKYCPQTSNTFQSDLHYAPLRVGDVNWNYETFLVNRQGKAMKRYDPDTNPLDLKSDIENMLKMKGSPSRKLEKKRMWQQKRIEKNTIEIIY
ncbi:hypothetical protein SNE40_005806 [Patella caerulea]|uniref:Glutathione peroxidase n=1 Tax=Patella caerulea TaxID=87958 RepID=A0AAN8K2D6_PATCE